MAASTGASSVGGGGTTLLLASFLFSALAFLLLLSLDLLLEWPCVGAAAVAFTVGRNQKVISSSTPSVSSTNLAGYPSSLQRSQALPTYIYIVRLSIYS